MGCHLGRNRGTITLPNSSKSETISRVQPSARRHDAREIEGKEFLRFELGARDRPFPEALGRDLSDFDLSFRSRILSSLNVLEQRTKTQN